MRTALVLILLTVLSACGRPIPIPQPVSSTIAWDMIEIPSHVSQDLRYVYYLDGAAARPFFNVVCRNQSLENPPDSNPTSTCTGRVDNLRRGSAHVIRLQAIGLEESDLSPPFQFMTP